MARRSKHHDEEPLSAEDTAALRAITDVAAEHRADQTASLPVVAPGQDEPPTGEHGVDPIGALATLDRIPELAAVTWHWSPSTRNRIDGSLTIPADPDLRPMSPEQARHELERFGAWLAKPAAPTVRTVQEGRRTRVIVAGVLHGVEVTLSALMPPADPLASTTPPTVGFVSVPEATPVAVGRPTHPYIGPQYEVPPVNPETSTGDAA